MKASHDAVMMKVDELSAQDEKMKSLDLEMQLQSSTVAKMNIKQVSATWIWNIIFIFIQLNCVLLSLPRLPPDGLSPHWVTTELLFVMVASRHRVSVM